MEVKARILHVHHFWLEMRECVFYSFNVHIRMFLFYFFVVIFNFMPTMPYWLWMLYMMFISFGLWVTQWRLFVISGSINIVLSFVVLFKMWFQMKKYCLKFDCHIIKKVLGLFIKNIYVFYFLPLLLNSLNY